MQLIIQLIGFAGIIAAIISFQCKRHNKILFFRTASEFLFGVQYIFLGAYTGAAVDFISCVRNVIFSKRVKEDKKTTLPIILFCIAFTAFGIFTWQGMKSILVIFAKVLSTVGYGNKNTTFMRIVIFITSCSWLIYNIYVFSIAGVLCEMFNIASLIAGIIRFDIIPYVKRRKAN